MTGKLSLDDLRKVENTIAFVTAGSPQHWDCFDETVPAELIEAWKARVEADKKLHEVGQSVGLFVQSKFPHYVGDDNHRQWLETVPHNLHPFVDKAVAIWNAEADGGNQWSDLGWDERDELLREAAVV